MARNFSIRVPWHDLGWTGKVCADPANNQACRAIKGIAERRNADKGIKCEDLRGLGKDEWGEDFTPPCLKENGCFLSSEEHSFTEIHPYVYHKAFKHVLPTDRIRPADSFDGTPYRWMLKPRDSDPGPLSFHYAGYDEEIEPMRDKI
ncbi:MAG: hypothetical protein HDQ93_00100 [Desulfovibrio sp.]|nr:hypothetical protein [Desulfovibrio sp.]